jgi:hypothetical protein
MVLINSYLINKIQPYFFSVSHSIANSLVLIKIIFYPSPFGIPKLRFFSTHGGAPAFSLALHGGSRAPRENTASTACARQVLPEAWITLYLSDKFRF